MSTELVALAVLMAAVTYPARAIPLLAPGVDRLPPVVLEYLRLIGPATLAALAVTSVLVVVDAEGARSLRPGVETLAVHAGHVQLHPPEVRRPAEVAGRGARVEDVGRGVVRGRRILPRHPEVRRDPPQALQLAFVERHGHEHVERASRHDGRLPQPCA